MMGGCGRLVIQIWKARANLELEISYDGLSFPELASSHWSVPTKASCSSYQHTYDSTWIKSHSSLTTSGLLQPCSLRQQAVSDCQLPILQPVAHSILQLDERHPHPLLSLLLLLKDWLDQATLTRGVALLVGVIERVDEVLLVLVKIV